MPAGRALAALALVFNAFTWGVSWWPFRRLQDEGLHPLWLTALAFWAAVVVLLASRPAALAALGRERTLWVLVVAAGTTNACFNWAVTIGDVVRVVLLFYLMPLWAVLLARGLLGERISNRGAFRVALALLGAAVVLWPLLAWGFATDRGIGFQDEGLYLLAADPPSPTAGWVTPFGWHTAPFFEVVGHDIARFRTLGLWLLVLAGALLGHTVGRRIAGEGNDRAARSTRIGVATIGALGAPLLASGFLRTPGYNWVNLLGLMLAITGTVLASTVAADTTALWRSLRLHVAIALLALGVWFTVPAKPSSAHARTGSRDGAG